MNFQMRHILKTVFVVNNLHNTVISSFLCELICNSFVVFADFLEFVTIIVVIYRHERVVIDCLLFVIY
jgi:hypothetical protein